MTDKVQKIKDWISKEQDGLMDAQGNFENPSDEEAFHILSNLDYYIDSLQEEHEKCMYTKDNYTDEDRKVLCDGCEEECEYNKKEPCIPDIVDKHFDEMLEDTIEKQFKVGDVVIYAASHIAYAGLYLLGNPNDLSIGYSNANEPYNIALRNCTVASEKEHKQFMRELESNGYKWNESSLRIEKKEGSVNEDLGEYINELSKQFPEVSFAKLSRIAVRVAKWQKEHLWKPADGDDLPIIDREVIALLDNGKVVYAHRPPEYWDGKNIITGEVTRNYPKTYDKGGWNIPDVKWWLDCNMDSILKRNDENNKIDKR